MKIQFSIFKKEWVVITLGWVLIFASSPLYMYYSSLSIQEVFEWSELWRSWLYLSAFLALFLLNHYLLIPRLVVRKHTVGYLAIVAVLAILFTLFLQTISPIVHPKGFHFHEVHEPMEHFEPMEPFEPFDPMDPMEPMEPMDPAEPMEPVVRSAHQAPWLAPPDLARLVIALLMMGVDLGVVAWFNEQKMRQRLLLLEQQNLKQELEHLRYQINPHFFMNTLNNIHVLIDEDPAKAQKSIVELSRLMRYALYNGSTSLVPLSKEVEFVQLYVSLMKLRYCDTVDIQCNMPKELPDEIQIPPLLLATFVENAFKHGISYQHHSFIYVYLSVDENRRINFQCINSRHKTTPTVIDDQHGIGLSNVKKRLDLQYGERYSLIIDEMTDLQYIVSLDLPGVNEQI